MKKKKHDAIVYEPKELLNPSPNVTNCCKSLWVKYSFQNAYMTQLVSSRPVSAMSRNPDHNPPSQPKEDSVGQSHHREEIIHKLAVQLRNIGDSIEQRMVREDIIQKIVQLLQKVGDQWEEEQHQALHSVVTRRNAGPVVKKKSQEKMSSLKRAFSFKKYGPEEPKRAGAAHVSSPESRPPKRPNFLPLCVGGHRPSSSSLPGVEEPEVQEAPPTDGGEPSPFELCTPAESGGADEDLQQDRATEFKELIIQELVALLQEVDGQLEEQIKRHPSFKKFFYKPSVSSLRKLAATLRSQGAHATEPQRTYPFVFGLGNQCAGNNYHTVPSLTGLHYRRPSYGQFPYEEAQQNITSSQIQSPD
ncbi:hypothetical protein G4228_004706 [Cervus hanglu yarkandensis]|nr:hypothetical protein G4228_004706 [Cervus hanglu yarkandensis]